MDFVKEDTVLGTRKVVVGDKFHDLVLENLGKIYIRYGNSYKEFNALMSALSKGVASGGSKVIIEEDGISDDLSIYPNGSLVYDARSGILYLIFNEEAFILAEHVNTNSSRYVLKTGDTMTGPLTINTKEAPLKVKSTELVKNFNANYLQGYGASAFARRNYDETINGSWTFTGKNKFTNKNTFEDTAVFTGHDKNAAIRVGTGNIITDGGLGSSVFVSGMNGSGWRLDSETNTLEIDNLIVRGILNVYELVVNKVSATNGSLWVTDSFKIKTVHNLEMIEYKSGVSLSNIEFSLDKYYLFYQNVTQQTQFDSFASANITLDLYNHAKITVPGQAYSTRTHKEQQSTVVDVYKYVFQIISIERLRSFIISENNSNRNITAQDLCKINVLKQLQASGVIDFTCIYQYNAQDIPDKMEDVDDVFNIKFDQNHFKIVTNPQFQDGKYYFYDESNDVAIVNLYYKYFGGGELYILESENDEYPVFKPGDILKCQKFTGRSVKQYHGVVCGLIGSYGFILQLQNHSILNRKTEVGYDSEGNLLQFDSTMDDALYNRSDSMIKTITQTTSDQEGMDETKYDNGIRNLNSSESMQEKAEIIEEYAQSDEFKELCTPQEGDGLVRVGSIVWGTRRNSMYLTSSENYSPFQDIMVGVNRPDYGVVYFTPKIRKCTVQIMIDEQNEIYKEQEVYLQNQQFCNIMDTGFGYLDELNRLNPGSSAYSTKLQAYNTWLLTSNGQVFSRYKDDVYKIDVPASQSDKGDQDFYGLTNLKDVYLTYSENEYEPKYYDKDGNRIRVNANVINLESNFYTAPKIDGQPIKVLESNIHTNSYEQALYQSSGSQSKILAIGWRI